MLLRVSTTRVIWARQCSNYTMNINGAVDKEHERKTFNEILHLPPSALQGIAEHSDSVYASLRIKSVAGLGKWKYFKAAKALSILSTKEEEKHSVMDSKLNLNKLLDKEHELKSLKEILLCRPSAFAGLTAKHDEALQQLKIHTIADIASWKYARTANAIVELAKFENIDTSSMK
jgi:hypothetical protein